MSGEGVLANCIQNGGVSPVAGVGSGITHPAPTLSADHLQIVRRAVAATFEAEGFERFAEGVRAGRHDEAGRMRVGIAVAAALIREIFE